MCWRSPLWRYVQLSKQVLVRFVTGAVPVADAVVVVILRWDLVHTGGDGDGFLFSVSILAGDDGFPLAAVMLDQNLAVVFLLTVF